MHDRRKRQCTFHVNMLRKWHEPPASAFTAMEEWLMRWMERTCQYGKAITAASNSVFDGTADI